jgi:hypothetical protein
LIAVSENKGIAYPEGSLVVTHVGDLAWTFEYPRLEWEILESFHDAIGDWQMGNAVSAEETFRQLIDDYPEFIDVHHYLALLLSETGRDGLWPWAWLACRWSLRWGGTLSPG